MIRDGDSISYYAPGLDMLASDVFISDHCFSLQREAARMGVSFEPTGERRDIPEIRGTMWLDLATSSLQSLEFRYVNLPIDIDASAGAGLTFARLPTGEWVITTWDIRMPVLERRIRSQAFGGDQLYVRELSDQGGELILASRGKDTLFAAPPRVARGAVLDSASGHAIAGARLAVAGLPMRTVTDTHGRYELHGLLPGEYDIEVHTPSLDSIGASYHTIATLGNAPETDMRIPDAALFVKGTCGANAATAIFGALAVRNSARVPRDSRVVASWRVPRLHAGGDGAVVEDSSDHREAEPDSTGAYHLCGLPAESDVVVSVESDSAVTDRTSLRLHDKERFRRVDFMMDRGAAAFASLTGVVRRDSSRAAVNGAEVALPDLGRFTTTDSLGRYMLGQIAPGEHRVVVRKLGLSGRDTMIAFSRATAVRYEPSLASAQVLKAVKTLASALPPSFDDHMKMGLGSFLTREQLEKQEGRQLRDVLVQLRGTRVVQGTGTHAWIASSRRQDVSPGGQVMGDEYTAPPRSNEAMKGIKTRCYSKVYIDRVLMNPGKPTEPFDLGQVSVQDIEAIEYFAGASEVPNEYAGLNTNCGVLVIWTRKSP